MKILVIGDYISDVYTFGKATRLCPEAPVPVIVPEREETRRGGAGLVKDQLRALGADAVAYYGSFSEKHRYFAGNHLVARIDIDTIKHIPLPRISDIDENDVLVISDYGKGAMTKELAQQIIATGKLCFVDAKHHWEWYESIHSIAFPNEHEQPSANGFWQIAHKLGARGCKLWCENTMKLTCIPATVSEIIDTTGAGDIFMASFVYAWTLQLPAEDCLRFANELAGESCHHLGTYVVPREFAQGVLDRLRSSKQSVVQDQQSSHYSNALYNQANIEAYRAWNLEQQSDIPQKDWSSDRVAFEVARQNRESAQTLPQSPLGPTESIDTPLLGHQKNLDPRNSQKSVGCIPSSTDSGHLHERKPRRDQVLHPRKS